MNLVIPVWDMKLRGMGVAMATKNKSVPIILVGDGSYLMMNSDIYSSVLSGQNDHNSM